MRAGNNVGIILKLMGQSLKMGSVILPWFNYKFNLLNQGIGLYVHGYRPRYRAGHKGGVTKKYLWWVAKCFQSSLTFYL